jgi:CubicO group peptidase (beta-lactamase class C family)
MMKRAGTVMAFLTVCVVLLISGTIYYYRDSVIPGLLTSTVIPGFTWETATPESQGLDTAKLDSMWSTLRARNTVAFLVIRNDKIVCERYVSFGRNQRHFTASMAKGLVGGMALMVAMTDGLISPGDLVQRYVPQWTTDPK